MCRKEDQKETREDERGQWGMKMAQFGWYSKLGRDVGEVWPILVLLGYKYVEKSRSFLWLYFYVLSICSLINTRGTIQSLAPSTLDLVDRSVIKEHLLTVTSGLLEIYRGQGGGTKMDVVNSTWTSGAEKVKWIHSFSKCGLSPYVPGSVWGIRGIAVNKTDKSLFL